MAYRTSDIEISAKTVGELRKVNGSLLKRTGANVALWFSRSAYKQAIRDRMLRSKAEYGSLSDEQDLRHS
jgi:hypothetical protein